MLDRARRTVRGREDENCWLPDLALRNVGGPLLLRLSGQQLLLARTIRDFMTGLDR